MLIERITQIKQHHKTIIRTVQAPHIPVPEPLTPPTAPHVLLLRDRTTQTGKIAIRPERLTQVEHHHVLLRRTVARPHIPVLEPLTPIPIGQTLLITQRSAQPRIPAMLIERITQIKQHHKTFGRTLRPDIAMLKTLTPPTITQLLFVFNRVSQNTMFKITARPFSTYIPRRVMCPRFWRPRNSAMLKILITVHFSRCPVTYLISNRIANHTITTANTTPLLAHVA